MQVERRIRIRTRWLVALILGLVLFVGYAAPTFAGLEGGDGGLGVLTHDIGHIRGHGR